MVLPNRESTVIFRNASRTSPPSSHTTQGPAAQPESLRPLPKAQD
jgi:hypothetical protein